MSAVAELTDALIAAGKTPGEAAALLARAHAEMATPKRSKGAERTARWRAKQPSQTVTERHAVTPETQAVEASPSVTERHKPSRRDAAHIYNSLPLDEKDSIEKEESLEAPRTKRASRIPDDWQLDQRHIDYALSKGVAPERIPIIGEKFKLHWQAAAGKGSTSPNWFLKWCTWIANEIDWNGKSNAATRQNGASSAQAGGKRTFAAIALERARASEYDH
jgi:hypothetical protein